MFTPGNDIINNSKKLTEHFSWDNSFRPFYIMENHELVLDNSFKKLGLSFLKNYFIYKGVHYFRLLEVINRAKHVWHSKYKMPKAEHTQKNTVSELGLSDHVFLPPKTTPWKNAWLITEQIISKMNQNIKENNALFATAIVARGERVDPYPAKRESFRKQIGAKDLFYPEHRLQSLGQKKDFPVIALLKPLQQITQREGLFISGFKNTTLGKGHWNETGHLWVGKILVDELCTQVIMPTITQDND